VAIQVVGQLSTSTTSWADPLWLVSSRPRDRAGGGCRLPRRATPALRELSEIAERVRATRDLTQRIEVEEATRRALARSTPCSLLDEAQQRQRQLVQDARLAPAHEPANEHRGARDGRAMPPSAGHLPRRDRPARRDDRAIGS
jgi:hypothetical protein